MPTGRSPLPSPPGPCSPISWLACWGRAWRAGRCAVPHHRRWPWWRSPVGMRPRSVPRPWRSPRCAFPGPGSSVALYRDRNAVERLPTVRREVGLDRDSVLARMRIAVRDTVTHLRRLVAELPAPRPFQVGQREERADLHVVLMERDVLADAEGTREGEAGPPRVRSRSRRVLVKHGRNVVGEG